MVSINGSKEDFQKSRKKTAGKAVRSEESIQKEECGAIRANKSKR
jgi:hypothetical protein